MTELDVDVLYISPSRFRMAPQVGVPCAMPWSALAAYLSRPSSGDAKEIAGGYSPALYRDDIRRKSNLVRVCALVLDFDESGVDDVAEALGRYATIVHETFSSTNDQPRCRALVRLAEPLDAATYEVMHRIARSMLASVGLPPDEGAKDASRLSFSPVRRDGAGYRFRQLDGVPLDARAVLAAQPKPAPSPRVVASPPSPEHLDRYVAGALRRAADEVAQASDGVRHFTLCREAFTLARLGLLRSEIEAALLPAFVAAAGERRRDEGIRTIQDALRARRGAA